MRRKINGDERSGRLHERYRKLYLVSAGGMTVLNAVGQHGSVCRRDRDVGEKKKGEGENMKPERGSKGEVDGGMIEVTARYSLCTLPCQARYKIWTGRKSKKARSQVKQLSVHECNDRPLVLVMRVLESVATLSSPKGVFYQVNAVLMGSGERESVCERKWAHKGRAEKKSIILNIYTRG
ncbi:hypothetical protein H109_05529 [Trichophyton interdigitale MR816]|uniref:Uncharacterized protein n=1 Tax=Trichophyton interdigitale (strain MR816) TaxID=1215338 RepID=A0A059J3V3_TRIIM|nr:hypothetical protein H109_05529 [Trichophyton interdigitale MR816]